MLALDIEWLGATYEAGLDGRRREWPPHPARAFCALVAVAVPGTADDDALRWLERQPAPAVLFPPAQEAPGLRSYVPTNATGGGKRDTSQQYVARTNGERSWPRSILEFPVARLVWTDAWPDFSVAARLSELARRVPYLGRATSPVLLTFSLDPPPLHLDRVEPSKTGASLLRAPYPGYLDGLRAAYQSGQRAITADRSIPYGPPPEPDAANEPVRAAYPDLLTLAFDEGKDGRHALPVARAWKAAVLQRLGHPLPSDPWSALGEERLALVHGHHDGSRRQCAFLALPFVGRPHATGELMGVGLGVSPDLDREVRGALLQLFGLDGDEGPRLSRMFVPGMGRLALSWPEGQRTTNPQTWNRSARIWETILPIVLDHWPSRARPPAEIVADGCVMAGYPRPANVEVRSTSVVPGAPWIGHAGTRRPRPGPSRPSLHAILRFSEKVPGPVVIGHLRHLGLGLCWPR